MARKKSKPSVRIEYDMLSDELKKMYDEIYLTLKKKNMCMTLSVNRRTHQAAKGRTGKTYGGQARVRLRAGGHDSGRK